jgi:hypothetical protein
VVIQANKVSKQGEHTDSVSAGQEQKGEMDVRACETGGHKNVMVAIDEHHAIHNKEQQQQIRDSLLAVLCLIQWTIWLRNRSGISVIW